MKKNLLLLTALFMSFSLYAYANNEAAPKTLDGEEVILRTFANVDGNYVLLKDIFEGVYTNNEKPVAMAPKPGETIILDAKHLYKIAKNFGLDWRPISIQSNITIKRSSNLISNTEIETEVNSALKKEGVEEDSEIVINNRNIEIHTPVDSFPTITVKDISFDNNKKRFVCGIEISSNGQTLNKFKVSGQIFPVSSVPVLKSAISTGNRISKNDITWLKMRVEQIRSNTIIEAERIIGMEAKKSLKPGLPIQTSEIDRPVLVNKGQLISMVISTKIMTLTAKGEALENGCEGDFIKVENTRSKKVVQGRVINEGIIAIDNIDSKTAIAMQL